MNPLITLLFDPGRVQGTGLVSQMQLGPALASGTHVQAGGGRGGGMMPQGRQLVAPETKTFRDNSSRATWGRTLRNGESSHRKAVQTEALVV